MNDTNKRRQLFDNWAVHYDDTVRNTSGFPFDGYADVLERIVQLADIQPGMQVLDVGTGTGNLAKRFVELDCKVWGIDFSPAMLAEARTRLPQAALIQADVLAKWPSELNRQFDRVVSAYVLHEFDLSTKVDLLLRFKEQLAAGGKIVIGDIAFHNRLSCEQAHRRWSNEWDEDEYYWLAYQTITVCASIELHVTYEQASSCGGVFVFEPI